MRRIALLVVACATFSLVPTLQPWPNARGSRVTRTTKTWFAAGIAITWARQAGPELQAWTQLLQRGMSPLDLQATILGSDEYLCPEGA